jgi:uncharacterized protein
LAVVVNLGADSLLEDADMVLGLLREKPVRLVTQPVVKPSPAGSEEPQAKRGLIVGNGSDLPGAADNVALVREMVDDGVKILPVSATTGENLHEFVKLLFDLLHVIRVYAKPPGKPADKTAPFIVPIGSTVLDLAQHIHKDIAEKFKHARVWGEGVFPGQQVHHDHVLHDKDVVEIHV